MPYCRFGLDFVLPPRPAHTRLMPRIPLILPLLFLLVACNNQVDDERLRLSLMSDCIVARSSLLLSGKYPSGDALTTVRKECHDAYGQLLAQVSSADLRKQQNEVYESFRRAYRMKYSLHDVFENLPPSAKKAYEKQATILFGLDQGDQQS